VIRWFEHSQIFQPDRFLSATGAELGRPFEDVFFKTNDGLALNGWFFPAAFNSPRREMAVLVCHGNAGNISHRLELCQALLQTGVNVFLFDYRGYGRSEGRPGEEGTYCDAQAAHGWLVKRGVVGRNILAFGESLGGGIASELALREACGGLILENTFSCLADLGAELFPWLPVRWMSTVKYETCARLPRLKIPVLVMHSRGDKLIGFHHAEKNFALANEPKLFWELQGGHNDAVFDDKENFVKGMEKFIQIVEAQNTAPKGQDAAHSQ
jgi:fermentation-respiration switch protein FrsA (DUF1100 family)